MPQTTISLLTYPLSPLLAPVVKAYEDTLEKEDTTHRASIDQLSAELRDTLRDLGVDVSDPAQLNAVFSVIAILDAERRGHEQEGCQCGDDCGVLVEVGLAALVVDRVKRWDGDLEGWQR